jgi:hypothetical protein
MRNLIKNSIYNTLFVFYIIFSANNCAQSLSFPEKTEAAHAPASQAPGLASIEEKQTGEGLDDEFGELNKYAIRAGINLDEDSISRRIFQAFSIVVTGGRPYDSDQIVDSARVELFRNPKATIRTLQPLALLSLENANNQYRIRSARSCFISICVEISKTEINDMAFVSLNELITHGDAELVNEAKYALNIARENNWRAILKKFQTSASMEAAIWIATNVLRPGLGRTTVETYLGKGVEIADGSIRYKCIQDNSEKWLVLRFWDTRLYQWSLDDQKWGSGDKEGVAMNYWDFFTE